MPDYISYYDRHKWMLSIKIGDSVYDCRNQLHEIINVESHKIARWRVFFPEWVHPAIENCANDFLSWFCMLIGWMEIIDKDVQLDDGAMCSVMHCCDSYDVDKFPIEATDNITDFSLDFTIAGITFKRAIA